MLSTNFGRVLSSNDHRNELRSPACADLLVAKQKCRSRQGLKKSVQELNWVIEGTNSTWDETRSRKLLGIVSIIWRIWNLESQIVVQKLVFWAQKMLLGVWKIVFRAPARSVQTFCMEVFVAYIQLEVDQQKSFHNNSKKTGLKWLSTQLLGF